MRLGVWGLRGEGTVFDETDTPVSARKFVSLSAGNPLCPYGIAYRRACGLRFGVWGSVFEVWGWGFEVWDLGYRGWDVGIRV